MSGTVVARVNGMGIVNSSWAALLSIVLISSSSQGPVPTVLPAAAATRLEKGLTDAKLHGRNLWRDTAPINKDGSVNAYIEIPRGDRRKFEFDIKANARALDRMIPADIGGYPVNYGFVPQTISYDGDPFDALVLGPPLKGGAMVHGVIVGVMFMEDEKGLDSKVVLSLTGADGRPRHELSERERREIGGFFERYKLNQPGLFSKVPGWGSIPQGLEFVTTTHAFFLSCRSSAGSPCRLDPK
jgi:inorganic pyrophosphatase